jgi:hypothetical protein
LIRILKKQKQKKPKMLNLSNEFPSLGDNPSKYMEENFPKEQEIYKATHNSSGLVLVRFWRRQ